MTLLATWAPPLDVQTRGEHRTPWASLRLRHFQPPLTRLTTPVWTDKLGASSHHTATLRVMRGNVTDLPCVLLDACSVPASHPRGRDTLGLALLPSAIAVGCNQCRQSRAGVRVHRRSPAGWRGNGLVQRGNGLGRSVHGLPDLRDLAQFKGQPCQARMPDASTGSSHRWRPTRRHLRAGRHRPHHLVRADPARRRRDGAPGQPPSSPEHPGWSLEDDDGLVVGYAYASPHRDRPAYQWSVEVSAYVDAAAHRAGHGRTLYTALFEILVAQGFANAYAGITLPNPASVGFHRAMGFEEIGIYQGDWLQVRPLARRDLDASAAGTEAARRNTAARPARTVETGNWRVLSPP